jgi:hypothetical protein
VQAPDEDEAWVVKMEGGPEGTGLFLCKDLDSLLLKVSASALANQRALCQRYISRPLLLRGFKFDMRLYVLMCSGGGSGESALPYVFVSREGLVRCCARPYGVSMPETNTKGRLLKEVGYRDFAGHFTNTAPDSGSGSGGDIDAGSSAAPPSSSIDGMDALHSTDRKRKLSLVLQQLKADYGLHFNEDLFWADIHALVQTVSLVVAPVLSAAHAEVTACLNAQNWDDGSSVSNVGVESKKKYHSSPFHPSSLLTTHPPSLNTRYCITSTSTHYPSAHHHHHHLLSFLTFYHSTTQHETLTLPSPPSSLYARPPPHVCIHLPSPPSSPPPWIQDTPTRSSAQWQ